MADGPPTDPRVSGLDVYVGGYFSTAGGFPAIGPSRACSGALNRRNGGDRDGPHRLVLYWSR
jgi:hypothetical protein